MEYSFENIGQRLTVPEAAQELRSGRMIMLLDHKHKHTDATLCLPAQFVNAQVLDLIEQVIHEEVAVVLSSERLEALQIVPTPTSSTFTHEMALATCVDVQIEQNASSNAAMIRALVNPATRPSAVSQPGRIAVLHPHPGGVLRRNGRIEAVSDLLRIAGLEPGAVIGEITLPLEDEAHARQLGTYWGGGILALDDIARFRKEHRVSLITETRLPTAEAEFRLRHFQEIETGQPYLALLLGDPQALRATQDAPLLRLHSACATGDIFGSQRCDCQAQLHAALQQIAREGRGILLYLPQEGRGIGLAGKLQAYTLQDQGYDTLDANEHLGYPIDARDYSIALEILQALGIASVRLLTNNPTKINTLREAGIVVESVPLEIPPNPYNRHYLQTKRQRMEHTFTFLDRE